MSYRKDSLVIERPEQLWRVDTRREFLRLLGIGGTIVMLPSVFAACGDDDNGTGPGPGPVSLNLSNDTGILNYAFALEQLEAAFYIAVVASAAFNGMSAEQKEVFTDLRNHEVIHREFFRQVLGNSRIPDLELNQGTVSASLASTASILQTSETFEDLGVAAYNGAGKYLTSADNLLVAGKIVSVEARHAAAIRDLREGLSLPGTPAGTRFAGDDVVNAQGLDVKLEPSAVLARVGASQFVSTELEIGTGPTGTATADQGPPSPTP
ncbi:MAG: ferritin-like domain-containing protein [Gemmatimonadota bacterium]|nr:ferritin-like domain-containing protein [Gemmatimonadota bacterium]